LNEYIIFLGRMETILLKDIGIGGSKNIEIDFDGINC
jgi:hypothetical protein